MEHLAIGDDRCAKDEWLAAEFLNSLGHDVTHLPVVVVARRGIGMRHRHLSVTWR